MRHEIGPARRAPLVRAMDEGWTQALGARRSDRNYGRRSAAKLSRRRLALEQVRRQCQALRAHHAVVWLPKATKQNSFSSSYLLLIEGDEHFLIRRLDMFTPPTSHQSPKGCNTETDELRTGCLRITAGDSYDRSTATTPAGRVILIAPPGHWHKTVAITDPNELLQQLADCIEAARDIIEGFDDGDYTRDAWVLAAEQLLIAYDDHRRLQPTPAQPIRRAPVVPVASKPKP